MALSIPVVCRRSQSTTSSANMSMESLPLLHQAPAPEPQPALKQGKDLTLNSEGSLAERSKQNLGTASAHAVSNKEEAPAVTPHADPVTADTSGMSCCHVQAQILPMRY